MAIERRIVQTRAGVVEASGYRVDLRAFLQEQIRRIHVPVHAGIHEGVINDALPVIGPRIELGCQLLLAGRIEVRILDDVQIAPWPVDRAGLRLQSSIAVEEPLDQIRPAQAGGYAEILNGRAPANQKIDHSAAVPIQRLLERRPATHSIHRGAGIQKQPGRIHIVATAARAEWAIQIGTRFNQRLRHVDFVRDVPGGQNETLKQRRMTG